MKIKLLIVSLVLSLSLFAQKYTVTGHISDKGNKDEALIGASVMYSEAEGVVADIDGNYTIELPAGHYTLIFSFVGYEKLEKEIDVESDMVVDAVLTSSLMMKEVLVVADVAIARETPVAFSTLSPKTLAENLASQDLAIALNSTPGVYATQEGGGDGDAEVTIRGFSSRNVGVLLDGVPVNDMETGHVYWSNWFGLDAVTRSMQVQRGLGASKLALPSVGGTINIITKGMESQKVGRLKQEVGSDGYLRTSFGYNTGKMKNGWAFSIAGSYKRSDGWVNKLYSKGFFYYAKVDKQLGNHILSLSAYGAPQEHGQRSYKLPIAVYDKKLAEKNGVVTSYETAQNKKDSMYVRNLMSYGIDRGVRYNQHWGYLARNKNDSTVKSEPFNERVNYYHKPQITLKDSWCINKQLFMSNILYMSIGNGGGTHDFSSIAPSGEEGLKNYQDVYDKNINNPNTLYADGGLSAATNFIESSVNEHFWYGLLSTINYEVSSQFSFSGGIDLRSYRGTHYCQVYDLLGADYYAATPHPKDVIDWTAEYPYADYVYKEGDKFDYYTDGYVRWGGAFLQLEYKTKKVSAFLNLTGARSSYNQIAHFYGRDSSIVRRETGWNSFWGGTVKTGVNYNINEEMNVFVNVGFLSKAPIFSSVYDYDNRLLTGIENELVKAVELGYSYSTPMFSANLNSYYTRWENKPMTASVSVEHDEPFKANMNGMDAIHKGVELDCIVKLIKGVDIQGIMSLGDWRWDTEGNLSLYDKHGNYVEDRFFNSKGIHVSNSAQTQFGGNIRWEPIKHLYIKPQLIYFARYFAEFDVAGLNPYQHKENFDENGNPYDSWQTPSYMLLDLHMGYGWKIFDDYFMNIRVNVLNVLNEKYIATAQDNDGHSGQTYKTHDARSAAVFMGLGRRCNLSLSLKF